MKKQINTIPFDYKRFFWGFHNIARYIGEPVTNKAGERLISVQAYDKDTAAAIKTLVARTFDIKGILTHRVDGTKFMIKY